MLILQLWKTDYFGTAHLRRPSGLFEIGNTAYGFTPLLAPCPIIVIVLEISRSPWEIMSLVTTCEGIEEDSEVDALDAGLKRVVGGSKGRGLVSCS